MSNPLPFRPSPIQFGTDGWRGILGVDVTIERVTKVAAAAAQELFYRRLPGLETRKIIIGYDRRFLAKELAEVIASVVHGCELEPLISESPLPTPACSWAVVNHQALGALVVTASHNPPEWLGLKIKGSYGGSVDDQFTKSVEERLAAGGITVPIAKATDSFDARGEHLQELRKRFDMDALSNGLKKIGLKVIVDSMHGSAGGCLADLFGKQGDEQLEEIRFNRDPLFDGNPPEPLAGYLGGLINAVKASNEAGQLAIGLAFDGDGDRIAAIDEDGRFCSTQLLMPLIIDHLARSRDLPGSVVKTVSGSDLMRIVGESHGRDVLEKPVGFKYIAEEMLSGEVLVGGEESGGIGFGMHLPERDALFTVLILLESLVETGTSLGERLHLLYEQFGGENFYQRIDLRLDDMSSRNRLENLLEKKPPSEVANVRVKEVIRTDGLKLRLGEGYWLLFRFSGTEPLLRLYCEGPSKQDVEKVLSWAKKTVESL